jgi:two-component system response regulator CpxR
MATNEILVIDDDIELCELLREYMQAEGFRVESVHDGLEGVEKASGTSYGMVVLDVMLPKLGGFEVLRRIRAVSQVPVIMLTARGDEVDRIVGLEIGADDYLPKPFNPRELIARLRAIQRRASVAPDEAASRRIIEVDDLSMDIGARSVATDGKPADLTSVEFAILEVLLRNAGKVVDRHDLSQRALGRRLNYNDRSIDVHVSSLRKKLGSRPDGSERIKSVRGIGYIYVSPANRPG